MTPANRPEPEERSCSDLLSDAAFEELYRETRERLIVYLTRRIGRDTAEELAAATFSNAWEYRSRYDPTRGEPISWLFGIAANLLREHYRDEKRRSQLLERLPEAGLLESPARAADSRIDANRELRQVITIIASMSAVDRDVLLLHAWANLDHPQIAVALDIEVGTVKSRLSRSRHRLATEAFGREVAND